MRRPTFKLRLMPRQNRVTPLGEVIATPERGLVYANRGCIHDASGRIRERRYPTKRWIACQLEFRGRHRRPLMAPGQVHRAVLPRRGDRARRRPPAVRGVPLHRLRAPDGDVGRPPPRPARGGRDRRATRRASAATPTPSSGASTRRGYDELPDGAFVLVDGAAPPRARLSSCSAGPRPATRTAPTARPADRHRDRDHATVAGRAAHAPTGPRSCRSCTPRR